jgi:hypothetical protein
LKSKQIPKQFKNERLRQGCTLLTSQTKRWNKERWYENEAIERCCIFANFSGVDSGKGRVFVMKCNSPAEAYDMVQRHNRNLIQEKIVKKKYYD